MNVQNKYPKWVIKYVILFFLILFGLASYRHFTMHSWLDLGLMMDVLNTTLRGKFFYSNDFGIYTSTHINVNMILTLPFYYLLTNIYTMLFVYVGIISITGLFIYDITRILKKDEYSKIILIIFFTLPVVWKTALEDFQPIAFAMPFFAYALYKIINKEFDFKYYIGIIGLTLAQENAALITIFIGLYLFYKKEKEVAIKTTLIGLIWFIVTIFYILPKLSNKYVFLGLRYSYLGDSFTEIIKTLITRPIYSLTYVSLWLKIKFVLLFFGAFLFLPFANPLVFLSIPIIIPNLLSTDLFNQCINSHHSLLLPVVLITSLVLVIKKYKLGKKILLSMLIISLLIAFYHDFSQMISSPNKLSTICHKDDFRLVPYNPQNIHKVYSEVKPILNTIPKESTIVASTHTYAQFPGYKSVKTGRFTNACYYEDFLIVDTSDGDYNFENSVTLEEMITDLLTKYDIYYYNSGVYVLQKIKDGAVCV